MDIVTNLIENLTQNQNDLPENINLDEIAEETIENLVDKFENQPGKNIFIIIFYFFKKK